MVDLLLIQIQRVAYSCSSVNRRRSTTFQRDKRSRVFHHDELSERTSPWKFVFLLLEVYNHINNRVEYPRSFRSGEQVNMTIISDRSIECEHPVYIFSHITDSPKSLQVRREMACSRWRILEVKSCSAKNLQSWSMCLHGEKFSRWRTSRRKIFTAKNLQPRIYG